MVLLLSLLGCGPEADVPPVASVDPAGEAEAQAVALLDPAGPLLAGVGTLVPIDSTVDAQGFARVRLQQKVGPYPVFGGETLVVLRPDGTPRKVIDHLQRDIAPPAAPAYTADEATAAALAEVGDWGVPLQDPELVILRRDGRDHLVYQVDLDQLDTVLEPALPRVFVSAATGQVIWWYDDLKTATADAVTTYNGAITFPATISGGQYYPLGDGYFTASWENTTGSLFSVTSSSSTFTDEEVADVQYGMVQTDLYYDAVHGRDGIDGSGGPAFLNGSVTAGVRYSTSYNNAAWVGLGSGDYMMIYGEGDGTTFSSLTTLDITAHELTHGVTQYTANLTYADESGALNEHMSDAFAALVEHHVRGDSPDVWWIGEQCSTPSIAGDALRYMDDPTADGISLDHYTERYTGDADNGGVHLNSGIANLAFYLLVNGGTHPDPDFSFGAVSPVGTERAGAIWYRALTTYLAASSGFVDARSATIAAAEDLYGVDSYEAIAVSEAWAEVGVFVPDEEDLADTDGGWTYFTVDVPADATQLQVTISGGDAVYGGANLYTRFGSQPTTSQYACRPFLIGNDESCVHDDPAEGTWHIGIHAYDDYSGVDLSITVITGCGTEVFGNGIDEDCDGLDAVCGTVVDTGCDPALAITEIFPTPVSGGTDGAWIEIENLGTTAVDLIGAVVRTDAGLATLDDHLALGVGERTVVAADAVDAGFTPGALAPGLSFGSVSDTVTLEATDGTVLDTVTYDSAFSSGTAVPAGASLSLDPDFVGTSTNDVATYWCDGRSAFASGDFGTPGTANDDCDYTVAVAFTYDLDGTGLDCSSGDACGSTTMSFLFDATERWFITGNSGQGVFSRDTDATGQSLTALYDATSIQWTGTRAFGTDCFAGGAMVDTAVGTAPDFFDGSWSAPDCP